MAGLSVNKDDPLFTDPWRKIKWEDKESALQYVNDYKPQSEGQRLRILLYGPTGDGKSSFINSVQSALRGRISTSVLMHRVRPYACDKYSTYVIQKGSPKSFYPFVFADTLGLDRYTNVLASDIKLALMGHVREGYMFNPGSKLSEESEFYDKNPTDNDKADVLVCVVSADTCGSIGRDTNIRYKIQDIRSKASHLGIPHVAIVTKVDEACLETKKDLTNIYRSKNLKENMETFSKNVGFPMNCIFPVKNYHEEIDVNDDTDSLILSALKCIINYGDDYLNRTVV